MKNKILFITIIVVAFLLNSCKKDAELQNRLDEEQIKEYLQEHNLSAKRHSSGLYYIITKKGEGATPHKGSYVEVSYKGYLTDGSIFDESKQYQCNLNSVIEGWQIGIPLIRERGSAILLIPSKLGYGNKQVGKIPANSVLIFEVDLLEIL